MHHVALGVEAAGAVVLLLGEGEDEPRVVVVAVAEERNDSVGGLYAEGDVMHAYAACDCGTTYSEKWVVDG